MSRIPQLTRLNKLIKREDVSLSAKLITRTSLRLDRGSAIQLSVIELSVMKKSQKITSHCRLHTRKQDQRRWARAAATDANNEQNESKKKNGNYSSLQDLQSPSLHTYTSLSFHRRPNDAPKFFLWRD